jgi:parallel beta-helix repeat protein
MSIRSMNPFRSDHRERSVFSRTLVTVTAFILLSSLLCIVPGDVKAAATTYEVDDDAAPGWYNTTHFHTITEAVTAAVNGDSILVHPGTYSEQVTVGKSIDISSTNGQAVTTLSSAASRAFYVTGDNVNLNGFTVTGGASIGISSIGNHVRIQNCAINGVHQGMEASGDPTTIEGCVVTGYQSYGIEAVYSDGLTLANSTFDNTLSAQNYYGAYVWACTQVVMRNNTFLDNHVGGVLVSQCFDVILERNEVHGNGLGISVQGLTNVRLRNNSMTGNSWDFDVIAGSLDQYSLDIDASNNVTGGPVRYFVNQPAVVVPADVGYLGLVNCDGVSVSDLLLHNDGQGVLVAYSDDCHLENVSLDECSYGLWFDHTSGLRMEDCLINGSAYHAVRGLYSSQAFFGNCTFVHSGQVASGNSARLDSVPRTTFYRCNLSESANYGIYTDLGDNTTVTECSFWNDISGHGILLSRCPDSVARNNTVVGCGGGITIGQYSQRSLVEGNRALNSQVWDQTGILVSYSHDVMVRNNTVNGNRDGIWADFSDSCVIVDNEALDNRRDALLHYVSSYTIVRRNSVDGCKIGIDIVGSGGIGSPTLSNLIENNSLLGCSEEGIKVAGFFQANRLANNTIQTSSNTNYGIGFGELTSTNLICNNKITATKGAQDLGTNNAWNVSKVLGTNIMGGPYLGGNYFSAYSGTDANLDGIGDAPFAIDGGVATDYLPLVVSTVPSAPRSLQAASSSGQVTLQWLAPLDDGGSAISKYTMYRGPTAGSLSLLIELGVALSYVDMAVINGQTYYYAASATNAIGEGPLSNVASATPSLPVTVPTVTITSPSNSSYNHGSTWLNWTGSDSGSGIAYYEVQLDSQAWINKSTGLAHTFSSLTSGQHQLKVRAWNNAGNSRTAWVTVTTDLTPPSALTFTPMGQEESLDVLITVTMSEAMATFIATVNGGTTTVTWSGLVATLAPATPLQHGTNYQVRVNGTDLSGWPMSELVFGFRTVDASSEITCTGKVVEENGDPVVGATVTAGGHSTTTGSDGTFQLLLLSGTYTVTITLGERTKTFQFTVSEETHVMGTIALPGEPSPDEGMDWLWIVIVIVTVIALLFLFFLFWKRRKKDDEEKQKKKQGG